MGVFTCMHPSQWGYLHVCTPHNGGIYMYAPLTMGVFTCMHPSQWGYLHVHALKCHNMTRAK